MQIKIYQGSLNQIDGDINQYHLVTNHLIKTQGGDSSPIADLIMYAEKRYLFTLLTSGVRSGLYATSGHTPGKNSVKTYVPEIPQAEKVSDNAWAWRVQSRIQKAAEVVQNSAVDTTVGSSFEGGSFKLYIKELTINNQMVCTFPTGKQARVMGVPVQLANNKYLASFKCFPGDTFDWDTWMGIGPQIKTIFGGYTTVGERSRRGYAYFVGPDKYIQHTTKQRKSISMSGDAKTNEIIWYELGGQKGYVYMAEQQMRAQFLLEDEHQKWWGKSTMKDEYGNLLDKPSMYDEKGEPIIAGDGVDAQIEGANDIESSGSYGAIIEDDIKDMVRAIQKRKNADGGEPIVAICGTDAMDDVETFLAAKVSAQMPIVQNISADGKIGGPDVTIGYNFRKWNILGETVIFVKNPMMDDELRFPAKLRDGKLRSSRTIYFLDFNKNETGRRNIEIRARGRNGINRNLFMSWFDGFTGESGKRPLHPADFDEFHIFKENATAVYNSKTCGRIYPPVNA